jgi:N-acetylmuramoyl-L-alanine amidase
MKRVSLLLAAALLFPGVAAASSRLPHPPASSAATRDYVRVSDWTRAHGLQLNWLKREEGLQLVNPSTRITLAVDSQEAEVNGVQVRLLFPAVYRDNQLYLSQLDLRTTLEPIISTPAHSAAPIKTICLDPGHGGRDPGNHAGPNQEKKYTLLLAEELRAQLLKAGFKVVLTRTSDEYIELSDRPDIAKRRGADLFVSLHFNAFPQSNVRGAEVYCLTPAGAASTNARGEGGGSGSFPGNRFNPRNMLLAYDVQKSLVRSLSVEDRGVHRARFAVLRGAAMPAVLIEGGFMSHPSEGRKIFDPAYRREMARAISDGILNYKHQTEGAAAVGIKPTR